MSQRPPELSIPVLTEVIRSAKSLEGQELEVLLADLQTKLASRTFALADELLRSTFDEMEATLFAQISGELPRAHRRYSARTLRDA